MKSMHQDASWQQSGWIAILEIQSKDIEVFEAWVNYVNCEQSRVLLFDLLWLSIVKLDHGFRSSGFFQTNHV